MSSIELPYSRLIESNAVNECTTNNHRRRMKETDLSIYFLRRGTIAIMGMPFLRHAE